MWKLEHNTIFIYTVWQTNVLKQRPLWSLRVLIFRNFCPAVAGIPWSFCRWNLSPKSLLQDIKESYSKTQNKTQFFMHPFQWKKSKIRILLLHISCLFQKRKL